MRIDLPNFGRGERRAQTKTLFLILPLIAELSKEEELYRLFLDRSQGRS